MLLSEFVNLNSITRICHVHLQKDGVYVGGGGADPFKQRCKHRVTTSEGGGGWRRKPCCVGVYCSVLHRVIVGVLQCVAVCCSVLQCGQHGDGCRGSPGLFECKCVMA